MSEAASFPARIVDLSLKLDALIKRVCQFLVLATTFVLLVGLACNVGMRYLFKGGGVGWMVEIPSLLFPWMIAGGIILAAQQGSHIAIDVLRDALPPAGRRILIIFVNLVLVVAYLSLFSVLGEMMEIVSIERSPLLDMPASWSYSALAFCVMGLAVCSLLIVLRTVLAGERAALSQSEEVSS
ncbi:MAG: TRAP transporter small permease subunit [Lautropia sp.]|nr:TRAP transporter small permease subunit [Lautropia sp.]